MTAGRFLTVMFRRGKPMAGYLQLSRNSNEPAAKTKQVRAGLVVDFGAHGEPLGLEIVSPATATLQEVNEVLLSLNQEPLSEEEMAPLKAG